MADEPITEQVPSSTVQPAPADPTPAAPATPTSLLDDYVVSDDLDAPPAVPVAPEPAASTPAPPAHPRYLIDNALEMGVSQADIDRTSTDRLAEVIFHTQRALLQEAREQRRADQVQAVKDQPQPPANAPVERGAVAEEAVDLGINEEDFAPELVGMLKRVVGGTNKRIAALEAQLAHYQRRDFQREAESTADTADRVFLKYKHALGEKGRKDLAADSTEYQRRLAVIRNVAADNSNLPLEAKLDKWAGLLFGAAAASSPPDGRREVPRAPAAAPTRTPRPQRADGTFMSDAEVAELERWNGSAAARPTQRRGAAEPNGEVKARQSVEDFFRGAGAAEEDDTDQFPQ